MHFKRYCGRVCGGIGREHNTGGFLPIFMNMWGYGGVGEAHKAKMQKFVMQVTETGVD